MMKSYLSDRWQYVDMTGKETNQKRITTGVPQGSILGHFLFLLYINNLDSSSGNSKISLFADETTIFSAKKNVSFTRQLEIDLISDWMTSNKLTINIDQCEVMCFGSGNPPPLKIKDTPIQCKISCKYLGLHIDKWLRFNQHIEYLVKKLNKFCGLIQEFDTCSHEIAYWCFITLTQTLWLIKESLLMVRRLKPTWAKLKWPNEE